jgi:hypothetical protein
MTSPEMKAKGDAGSAGSRAGLPAMASVSVRATIRRASSILKPLSPKGFASASAASAARQKRLGDRGKASGKGLVPREVGVTDQRADPHAAVGKVLDALHVRKPADVHNPAGASDAALHQVCAARRAGSVSRSSDFRSPSRTTRAPNCCPRRTIPKTCRFVVRRSDCRALVAPGAPGNKGTLEGLVSPLTEPRSPAVALSARATIAAVRR